MGWGDGPTVNPRIISIGLSNIYKANFSPTTAVETLTFSNVSRTAPVGMPAVLVDGKFVLSNSVTRLDSAQVSLYTSFANGTLLFTLDGSEPSYASRLYGGPFLQRRTATIRAIAYDANFTRSWEADTVQLIIEPTYELSASSPGDGSVSVSPSNDSYRSNSLVTITATPDAGWRFLQWLGDAGGANTTNTLYITRDMCVQAIFGTALTTTVTGSGSVVAAPSAAFYPFGSAVRLTAIPQAGDYFALWGNAASSAKNPLLFIVTNGNPTVSCLFAPLNAGQAALTLVVNGGGRVTVSPAGNRFDTGQSVALTAWPDAEQNFLGWSGDVVGAQTNQAIVMTQTKTVMANFTRSPRLSLGACLGGFRDSRFQLSLTGDFGVVYEIDSSADLVHWTPVLTVTNFFGTTQAFDSEGTNRVFKVYRARLMQ
jgi:hypothetical protein